MLKDTPMVGRKINRDQIADALFFGLLCAAASIVTFRLFFLQAVEQGSSFPSDMKAYILEIQGLNETYSFPYPILFWLGRLIGLFVTPQTAMAAATMLLNSFGMVMLKLECNKVLLEDLRGAMERMGLKRFSCIAGMLLSLVSVSLFFISMLILPGNVWLPGVKFRCIGVFTPNPFYNATYMAARPFALTAFFSFVRLLERYEKEVSFPNGREDRRELLLFSVSLLLATMAKPSFTIVLVGAAGCNMLFVLICSRGKKLRSTLLLGICFLPTFLALLYQYSGVFVSREETVEAGIGFCIGEVWHVYCSFVPSALVMGMAFPFVALLLHFRELKKDICYRFSWQLYLMGFLMAYFLYEKGFRKNDFNFAWGYMYGIFFGFVGTVLLLIRKTAKELSKKKALRGETEKVPEGDAESGRSSESRKDYGVRAERSLWVLMAEWLFFFAHLISGMIYFGWLLRGASYF